MKQHDDCGDEYPNSNCDKLDRPMTWKDTIFYVCILILVINIMWLIL